jgi:Rrf2 family protein
MKLITRNTDYALRAICYISKQNSIVTVRELVQKLGVPRPFIRKILQQLNKERILESYKGLGGGFKLKVLPKKIYIIEIMRIFQGQVGLNGCFLKKNICPNRSKCVLRKKIRFIEGQALKQLKKISIASLLYR